MAAVLFVETAIVIVVVAVAVVVVAVVVVWADTWHPIAGDK